MAESQNCASSCLFEGKKSRWVYPFVVDKNARLLLLVVTRRSEAACGSLRNGRVAAFFFFHRKMFVWLQTGICWNRRLVGTRQILVLGAQLDDRLNLVPFCVRRRKKPPEFRRLEQSSAQAANSG
jgi:hypothetical protein